MRSADGFEPKKIDITEDKLTTTVLLQQTYQGLPVSGGELAVSMNDQFVIAVHGIYYPSIKDLRPQLLNDDALKQVALKAIAREQANIQPLSEKPFVRVDEQGTAHLVRSVSVQYISAQGQERDLLHIDTNDGAIVTHLPMNLRVLQTINDWQIETLDTSGHLQPTGRPGCIGAPLPPFSIGSWPAVFAESGEGSYLPPFVWEALREENGHAYGLTMVTADFYQDRFHRNSYDNRGSRLISNTHLWYYNSHWDRCFGVGNAFWALAQNHAAPADDERQMYYLPPMIDSSGAVLLGNLTSDQNVVTHELTHGVTELTSNLEYASESGALNEAASDIMAETAELWWHQRTGFKFGSVDWQVGTDQVTPGRNLNNDLRLLPGRDDALRYFYNPRLDADNTPYSLSGYSTNYYTDRFSRSCVTAGPGTDYCGVHSDSGILNLWFFLASRGGNSPPSSQSTNVGNPPFTDGIGLWKAAQIVSAALHGSGPERITSRATFREARNATLRAALRFFPGDGDLCSPEMLGVVHAWNKVGWADHYEPRMDWMPCTGQANAVLNGTLENGYDPRSSITHVSNWDALTDARLAAPRGWRDAGAQFMYSDVTAVDEAVVAQLGGAGAASVNAIQTRIAFDPGLASIPHPAARIAMSARAVSGNDRDDRIRIGFITTDDGHETVLGEIPADTLTDAFQQYSIALNPTQLRSWAGRSGTLKISLIENDTLPTVVQVDAISLVVNDNR